MSTRVVLGNRHAIHSRNHGVTYEAMEKGKRATVIDFDDDISPADMITTLTHAEGAWTYAAVGPSGEAADDNGQMVKREVIHADAKPAWVASDDEDLAKVLSFLFGGVPIRELEDVEGHHLPQAPSKSAGGGGKSAKQFPLMYMALLTPSLALLLARMSLMLKTNAGNDFQYNQMSGTPSATAIAKYVALTANTTAPASGDTTLTGEITTAGGGLLRKPGTPAHTTGAASYTITTVFTANGSDALPVTIGKRGIFDTATTGGNLVFSTLVSPTATLSASGDNLTLTDTISM